MHFRPLPLLTLFSILALCLLLGLGTWQVQRLQWKLGLIENIEARTTGAPRSIDALLQEEAQDDLEYWRVEADGVFDHTQEAHLYKVNRRGTPGYFIITVLRREGQPNVLVNRGHVPLDKKDPLARAAGQVTGPQNVTGLVRTLQERNAFTPENQLADNMWYSYDIQAMGAYLDAGEILPLILDADATPNPGGLPEGGHTQVQLTNDHLGYAITWYGLALALIGVYLAYHYKVGRLSLDIARNQSTR